MDSFAHHEESRGARWPHAGHLSRYASRRRYFGTHALALEAHGGRGIMRLGALAGGLSGDAQDEIVTGFAIDHRKVAPGTIFGAFEGRSEEHTSELQSLMRISYAVFCLTKKNK